MPGCSWLQGDRVGQKAVEASSQLNIFVQKAQERGLGAFVPHSELGWGHASGRQSPVAQVKQDWQGAGSGSVPRGMRPRSCVLWCWRARAPCGGSVVSADLPLSSGSAFTILSELEGALEIIWFKAVVL